MLFSSFVSNFIIALYIVLFLFQISYETFLCHVFIVSRGVVLHWIPNRAVRSGFEPWPGSFCCVFGQETLHSQCLSPSRLGGGGGGGGLAAEGCDGRGQSTCDKNIIITLLLTNDLPLFQPLFFFV